MNAPSPPLGSTLVRRAAARAQLRRALGEDIGGHHLTAWPQPSNNSPDMLVPIAVGDGAGECFFSVRPIVLSLARSTMPSSTTLFSNNRKVQRARRALGQFSLRPPPPVGGLELFKRPSPIIPLRPGSKECEMSKFSATLLLQLMFVCLLARLPAEPKHPHPMHD
jgi:hypothetical protein